MTLSMQYNSDARGPHVSLLLVGTLTWLKWSLPDCLLLLACLPLKEASGGELQCDYVNAHFSSHF